MRLLELKRPNIIVVYGGGFQPFHEGHASSYREAKAAFPGAYFFVAASNVTTERPFQFKEKQFLAQQAGVRDPFVQVGTMSYVNDNGRKVTSTPLNPLEVLQNFNPDRDILVIVRSERDPMKTTGVSYYQPWNGAESAEPFSKHAYIYVTKKHDFNIAGEPVFSGSQVRQIYTSADDAKKTQILQDLYPQSRQIEKIKKIFDKRLGVAEGLSEFAPRPGFGKDDDDDKYTPQDFGKPYKANYLGKNEFEVLCRSQGNSDPSKVIKLNAEVQKYGLDWDDDNNIWYLDSPGAVYLSWKYGEIPLPKAIDQARNPGHIHDLVTDYLTYTNKDEIQQVAEYFGFTPDGEMDESMAEASLATMRDYFAGDENARDPYEITKQRNWFQANKDKIPANAKTKRKEFRSQWEYEQWLKQHKVTPITNKVKEELDPEQEAENLLEFLRKIHKRWAIVSKKGGRPLVYFKGDGKPSKDWVEKQERRINYFKHKK
jgi:hypothetical protein